MKRLFIGLMVMALAMALTAGAHAAAFPPKTMCFQAETIGDFFSLSVKSAGTIKTKDGTVTFYTLIGDWYQKDWDWFFTASGAGRVAENGAFYFSVNGFAQPFIAIDGIFHPGTATIEIFESVVDSSGTYTYLDAFAPVDCTSLAFPFHATRAKK